MSDKIKVGGTGPNEPKPNVCFQCGKDEVVITDQTPMGQLVVGFCEEHKNYHVAYGHNEKLGGMAFYPVNENGEETK